MILSLILVLGITAIFCFAFYYFEFLYPAQRYIAVAEEYEEYESCEALQELWHQPANGEKCDVCGMSDCPVETMWSGVTKCKWCWELDNLTYHLLHHGVRRMKKVEILWT